MKKLIVMLLLLSGLFNSNIFAQEKYGKTLNLGLGLGGYSGYYKYSGRTLPVFNINYEFDVAKNFTLAPFVSFFTFSNNYYWGNKNHPERYYSYRATVIPIGVKGAYYFDELFKANTKWDFYAAGSLGFAIVNAQWEGGYEGDKDYYHGPNSVLIDLHFGAEYHFNSRVGAFLDLSTGVSTIGLAIHGK